MSRIRCFVSSFFTACGLYLIYLVLRVVEFVVSNGETLGYTDAEYRGAMRETRTERRLARSQERQLRRAGISAA